MEKRMTNPYLSISRIDMTFGSGAAANPVLKGISLDVRRGEFISLIGHSGCGKSTVLNIVAGLLRATSGGVIVDGREVNDPGPDRAVVFQNHSLLPWLTVYQNVEIAVDKIFRRTRSAAQRREWILRNLEMVHMEHAIHRLPSEISGGMKQRVGIARALAMEPKVLLLDEPFGALDVQTKEDMQLLIRQIWQDTGTTVLMVTHDVEEAVFLGQRVIVLACEPGRVAAELAVPLPAERDLAIKRTQTFLELRAELEDQVRAQHYGTADTLGAAR
jgi:nitrate/nitrite transport system ATP-binding protein